MATIEIPDSLFQYFKGYRTYMALAVAIGLPYVQKYLPWLTPDMAANLAWIALAAAVGFLRAGSKNDAADAIEAVKVLLETQIQPEAPAEK